MTRTIAEQLADFTVNADFTSLPAEVVNESKRLVLDSLACGLAAVGHPKGRIGIEYGQMTGGGASDATIIGTNHRASVFGAAFANGELINALDFDAVLPPGHVTPYVLPGALAVGESLGVSGKDLIVAVALAHEMSYRFGKAMDYHRTLKDGQYVLAPVLGFSSTVFGATVAIGKLKDSSPEVVANALVIAASLSPVNTLRPYFDHTPIPTIKYLLAGTLTQAAMTAAHMAQLGHRGNLEILDDAEFGYRRFIGTGRWAPEVITAELGQDWRFPAEQTYKPYPHCRALHGLLDALTDVVATNDLKPSEIDAIRAWGEGWVLRPVFLNRTIEHVIDGQFSSVHGLAVGAHRLPPGAAWQDPDVVFDPSVLALMDKISFEPHQDWATAVGAHAARRPSRVEIDARGATYVAETSYPHGTPSPDPGTMMTNDELAAKFRTNATNVITDEQIDHVVNAVLNLETITDIGTIMRGVSTAA